MSERINFKITLSGTYWDKKPKFNISVDGVSYVNQEISGKSDEIEVHEFFADIEPGNHTLSIAFENKTDDQTVKDPLDGEPYTIVKDMLLNVVDIEIDGIELGGLLWEGTYKFDRVVDYQGHTGISELKACLNMGWNGSYDIEFESPFYLWLLEKL
jgi:hypothetical protein